ncbi:hypothetical protein GCM10010404_27640 [Nonomuraea africana]|uniref:DUF4240 domain-containing protein n=1 Tax=Nonomuraea africana TaxID=46171 RepID=A0ABR9KNH7_9ACTN|nr:DUF6000 family protein [Nonomuraea africana]MBE1563586.1 hypothetical protein [Nonomuraea africana]
MRLPIPPDLKLIAVVRRYVSSGKGEVRRYLKLLGGGFMMLPEPDLVWFARSLAKDARRITDDDLELLLESEWRARLTAAWLIGLDRRTQFRERLGKMLLDSELVYSGQGYCFALARFGEDRDATLLTAYLDRYLPRLDCHYDQDDAIGALLHLDERRGTDHAARFLVPGGLWERSSMRTANPAEQKLYMDEWCAFADSCMTDTIDQWLPQRRRFLDRTHPMYGDGVPER